MTALAAEYGFSDVGLRKFCKRLNIQADRLDPLKESPLSILDQDRAN